jgi:hypothetical protein
MLFAACCVSNPELNEKMTPFAYTCLRAAKIAGSFHPMGKRDVMHAFYRMGD